MSGELPILEWESASVHDGTLTVEIAGDSPEHWDEVFAQTVTLLPGGEWDEVECKQGTVTVTGVRAGVEDRLAHFLESVVQQVNANLAPSEEEETGSSSESRNQEDPDAELTARFRAFGQ